MRKYLLDTHILLWFVNDDKLLPKKAREIISDGENEIYYSILSIWEIEVKHQKHPDKISFDGEQLLNFCKEYGFVQVPLKNPHIFKIKNLRRRENTLPHNDPFDKAILSQAIVEDMIFITHDDRIAEYDSPNIYKV